MSEFIITDFTPPNGRGRGLETRNYSQHPVGYNSKPFDIPLIPESEWQGLLDKQKAAKAQLHDIRNTGKNGGPIPSTDQGQTNFCVTEDTEVLTERGWVPYTEYNWKDLLGTMNPVTGRLEFQACLKQHVYEHNGPMIYSTNKSVDFGVTPDHRMLVRKWNEKNRTLNSNYEFQRAGDLGWYCGLPPATTGHLGVDLVEISIEDDRSYDGDDFLMMLSLIISDGYAGGVEKTRNWVSFSCFAEDGSRQHAVRALAARIGFTESSSRRGVYTRYSAGALANWVRRHCYVSSELGAPNKCVPQLVKEASSRQIRNFLNMYGDQSHKSKQETYFSTSKRAADDIQELLLRVGVRGSLHKAAVRPPAVLKNGQVATPRHPIYHVTACNAGKLSLERKTQIETETYKGLVFCATVPNGTLITRRNGSILISGNCWAHSSTSGVMLLRAKQGEPFAQLSATAIACKIKGFRNVGGWGAESLEYISENGVPTLTYWPEGPEGIKKHYDSPTTWENAARHKVTEWMDLQPRSKAQLVTCLLLNIPVVSDFNWWGHSVLTMSLVSLNPFRTLIWNSWGDEWSDNGTGILEGSKAIPDGMIAPRSISGNT